MKFDKRKSFEIAESILGMEFKLAARGPDAIDCYGVLIYFYKQFGIDLPDYSYLDDWDEKEELYLKEYATFFRKLGPGENPETGDAILFINTSEAANHAAVYIGENKFVHAYQKIGTKIDSLTNRVWKEKVYGFFRIKEIRDR